jgi:VCBS repeat-containing protein
VTEDGLITSGYLTASGTVSISDPDSPETFQTTVEGKNKNLGTLVLAADGSYTFSVANDAVQFLGANDTQVDTFTITSSDGTKKDVLR